MKGGNKMTINLNPLPKNQKLSKNVKQGLPNNIKVKIKKKAVIKGDIV